MKAWQIFIHSVRQLTGNFESALKISLIPTLIMITVSVLLFGGTVAMVPEEADLGAGVLAGITGGLIVVLIVLSATSIWIAVNWHRFVLLGEAPQGYIPTFPSQRVWAYFRRSIGVFLIVIAAVFGLSILGSIVGAIFLRLFGQAGFFVAIAVFVWLPIVLVGYRLSISLPGAAIGADGDLFDGWAATRDHNATIFQLAVISVAANLVLASLGGLLSAIPVLGPGIGFLSQWLVTMVGLSIMTTLYGRYVEGRALI